MEQTENIILIGSKEFMTYIHSIEYFLRRKNQKTVLIRARGRNIQKAVDVAEASRNKFLKDLNLQNLVSISTSNFNDNGMDKSVSCIEILIKTK